MMGIDRSMGGNGWLGLPGLWCGGGRDARLVAGHVACAVPRVPCVSLTALSLSDDRQAGHGRVRAHHRRRRPHRDGEEEPRPAQEARGGRQGQGAQARPGPHADGHQAHGRDDEGAAGRWADAGGGRREKGGQERPGRYCLTRRTRLSSSLSLAPRPRDTHTYHTPHTHTRQAVAKNMERTLDVPIFRVSRTIVTDKFDALYKVPCRVLSFPGLTVVGLWCRTTDGACSPLCSVPRRGVGFVVGQFKGKDKTDSLAPSSSPSSRLAHPYCRFRR